MTSTRTPLAAALTLAALSLGACATGPLTASGDLRNPGSQYALKAAPAVDRIALAPHTDGLSDAQLEALRALAARRAEMGGGVVTISLPHGPADAAAAGRTADAAQTQLQVAGASVRRSTYESDDPKAPLLVSFGYDQAEVPRCGRWDDLSDTQENGSYANFGCAVSANLAVQIAHPADIAHPRAEDPPNTDRRMTVLDKYATGKVTSAEEPQPPSAIAVNVGK